MVLNWCNKVLLLFIFLFWIFKIVINLLMWFKYLFINFWFLVESILFVLSLFNNWCKYLLFLSCFNFNFGDKIGLIFLGNIGLMNWFFFGLLINLIINGIFFLLLICGFLVFFIMVFFCLVVLILCEFVGKFLCLCFFFFLCVFVFNL